MTGGCGFIGSHLVDQLMTQENNVTVVDNLSSGNLEYLSNWRTATRNKKSKDLRFIKADLTKSPLQIVGNYDIVFHLAANPDVRLGSQNPRIQFEQNVLATYNLLEMMRKKKISPRLFVFTSTSTVYGEADLIPTPENYGPLQPISVYGASKLACEALISSYAHNYKFRAVILRLANVIGSRSTHGIIYDLLQKLRKNKTELEILGDGSQTKSYLHVKDCVSGILTGISKTPNQVTILNLGSEDQINVLKIADITCRESGARQVKYKLTPATSDGRGWPGDVKFMRLDVTKLKSLGWQPMMNSEQAVETTVRELIMERLRRF